MKTRKELEKLINGSPLFLIDRAKDKELFIAEERRFLADLAELLSLVRKDFHRIGFEIVSTAKACIKSYRAENGAFLNYFNVALKKSLFTQKDEYVKEDELFDFIADKTSSPDETVIDEVSVQMHIQAIDSAFQKQQDRTKPLLSKLLTARLLKALDDIPLIEKVISGISFINKQMYSYYKESRTVPTAREIAELYGVMEASASRTFNIFVEKIRKKS